MLPCLYYLANGIKTLCSAPMNTSAKVKDKVIVTNMNNSKLRFCEALVAAAVMKAR